LTFREQLQILGEWNASSALTPPGAAPFVPFWVKLYLHRSAHGNSIYF
jgi:hypothetical protein